MKKLSSVCNGRKACSNRKNETGMALIIVLIFLIILVILGFMLVRMTSLNIKTSREAIEGFERFYGAEGGVFSVSGWMTFYKRFDLPRDVLKTMGYDAEARVLEQRVRYQPGYSALWKGADVLVNSKSPPDNPKAEIEAVVFIPVAPVGYGNE